VLVGVLAAQGAFREHRLVLERCGAVVREVRCRQDLEGLDGLVIPGGESTAISCLLLRGDLFETLREKVAGGLATYGTCAGMILLAKEVVGGVPKPLGLMDIVVRRNAYGRQVDSFEAELVVPVLGPEPLPAVFIRAPYIEKVGDGVEVLATYDGRPVLARQGNCLVSSFHPELTDDPRLHQYFLNMIGNGA
jgi:5'-phosphate synthase pdxT subunit